MSKSIADGITLNEILKQVVCLRRSIAQYDPSPEDTRSRANKRFVGESGKLLSELRELRETVSPVHFGPIGITLGRSDGIAKFFAFSFANQARKPLKCLNDAPFFGSGVYAIYCVRLGEACYRPLSKSETPIYVGRSRPLNANAETVEEQGKALFKRLKEHSKSIGKAELSLADFEYRAAPIQTGMEAAVEDFMIRLFKPIWNKEVKICFGIGKHGDDPGTRQNKRSPWDTMHPGRSWADGTKENQMARSDIEGKIADHLRANPVIRTKADLFKRLALG